MSHATSAEDMYSAIKESARLVGVPCSRDKIWPILTAYEGAFPEAGMVFSVSTGERPPEELDYTITVPITFGDPYVTARSNRLVAETDHPVATLLSDIQARVPVAEYLIDAGVVGGFNKIYANFPFNLQQVSKLAEIPSMPATLAQSASLFERHHLNEVAMIGIDYSRKMFNLYFAGLTDEYREARNILSLHREIGLPEPDERWLEFAKKSFRFYATLSWDSPKVKRICFAHAPTRDWDSSVLPVRIEPEIEKFLKGSPHAYGGQPVVIAAAKWALGGGYLNLGPYCQLSPLMRNVLEKLTGTKL
jgi:Aromatic prenyltransferase Orf2